MAALTPPVKETAGIFANMKNFVRFCLAGAVVLLALVGSTHADERTMAMQNAWHRTTDEGGEWQISAASARGARAIAVINAGVHFAQVAGAPRLWCITQPDSSLPPDCTFDDFAICNMAASMTGGTCKARSNLIAPRRKAAVPSPPQHRSSKVEHDNASNTGSACRSDDLPPVLRLRRGQTTCQ